VSRAHKQLLQRFRASAIERLRRVALDLTACRNQDAIALPDSVGRELHTIKGEARLLGQQPVASAIHHIEELLRPERGPAGDNPAALAVALQRLAELLRLIEEMPLEDAAPRSAPRAAPAASRPPPEPSPAPSAASPLAAVRPEPSASPHRFLHVAMTRIDKLCDGVSELETAFRALYAQARGSLRAGASGSRALAALREEFERYRAHFDEVTSMVWALRLSPIEPMLTELAYHADELARSQQKQVRVRVRSNSAELERGILDALREPLLHLLRNAIDHGVELPAQRGDKPAEAALSLLAEPQGASVLLTVTDDGRGIDLEEVRSAASRRGLMSAAAAAALGEPELRALLFRHGFSTRSSVTELSGRGMGLDIVRSTVEALGGTIALDTEPGRGTTFQLTLPMRLSRERALVFDYGGVLYAIPARQVLDLLTLRDHAVRELAGGAALWCRDDVLPLCSMGLALGVAAAPGPGKEQAEPLAVVLATAGNQRWAFALGGVLGDFELLRKPCDALMSSCLGCVASATLDDGRLVLYLHLAELLQRADASRVPYQRATPRAPRRVLVVDDSAIIRHLLSLVLAAGGYEVLTADNGRQALRRCEERLPELIVSDFDMPEMDGLQMLGNVRARWPSLPVIIFTNHESAELRQRAQSLGANEYVVKSDFEQEQILLAAERVLRGRGDAA
jgi:chemotaxis protein histidine kinase CheA/CheY-like chemotaxis protein